VGGTGFPFRQQGTGQLAAQPISFDMADEIEYEGLSSNAGVVVSLKSDLQDTSRLNVAPNPFRRTRWLVH
jgi:hypothetical protein